MTAACEAFTPNASDYQALRAAYVTADIPDRHPSSIYLVRSLEDIVSVLDEARRLNLPVGVRSGGHTFSCPSLLQDGILIDTRHLNRYVRYDPSSEEIEFGPAATVREGAAVLEEHGRFFPVGHEPTVALGGFTLAGGQGLFMRGWGGTVEKWISAMEVVTADGKVVKASRTENSDLFWAARGSGQGFFGVVTRIWGKTVPAKKSFYSQTFVFRVADQYEELLAFALERNRATPKEWNESAVCTFYPERTDWTAENDLDFNAEGLMMVADTTVYADSQEEAAAIVKAWEDVPASIQPLLVAKLPLRPVTWADLHKVQRDLIPYGNGERWAINSMLNHPDVSEAELIQATKPVMCDLPTRTSVGCIYICDTIPAKDECAFSLPSQYYISTFTGWKDPKADPAAMKRPVRNAYHALQSLACGMYVADYDMTDDTANVKVMTDEALAKFLDIRQKWDPDERFPGYKAFIRGTKGKRE